MQIFPIIILIVFFLLWLAQTVLNFRIKFSNIFCENILFVKFFQVFKKSPVNISHKCWPEAMSCILETDVNMDGNSFSNIYIFFAFESFSEVPQPTLYIKNLVIFSTKWREDIPKTTVLGSKISDIKLLSWKF